MNLHFKSGLSAAALLISTSHFALADVTAQDVWADWKDYMNSVGYEVSGTETQSGNTLTVADLTMAITLPQDQGTVAISMGTLAFESQGDGTVAVVMPGNMPMQFSGKDGSDNINVAVNIDQSGHSMIVSGDPKNMTYAYNAAQIAVKLGALTVNGDPMPDGLARVSVTMSDVSSNSVMTIADMRSYSQQMNVGSLTYDAAFNDPGSDDGGAFNGSLVNLTFKGDGNVPPNMASGDIEAMLAAGFAFDGLFEYASGNANVSGQGDGEKFAMKSTSQGGRLGVSMDAAHLSYDVGQKGSDIEVTTNQLPFPVKIAMAEAGFKLNVPISESDQEQDFTFAVRLGDFAISDAIWGMVDPAAVLPRDPASIIVDLSGKVKVLANLMNPEALYSGGPPGELNALTINQVLVSAAGAKLTGDGDFTFDNSDLTSFDGIPAPAGVANLKVVGANSIIGKLIQMGLMAEADAMPARMMMGLLAVPGEGEDTLVSKIEITKEGHISANGQRIK